MDCPVATQGTFMRGYKILIFKKYRFAFKSNIGIGFSIISEKNTDPKISLKRIKQQANGCKLIF